MSWLIAIFSGLASIFRRMFPSPDKLVEQTSQRVTVAFDKFEAFIEIQEADNARLRAANEALIVANGELQARVSLLEKTTSDCERHRKDLIRVLERVLEKLNKNDKLELNLELSEIRKLAEDK